MAFEPLTAILEVGGKIIDKIFPDPAQRDAAKLELLKAQQAGSLEEIKSALSVIISDSQSADPWTSRARPTFLYVIYVMILMSIPMGVLSAFRPEMATAIASGMQHWLAAIPSELYALFGVGYTGYAYMRGKEKIAGVAQ